MRKSKLVHIVPHLRHGGAERMVSHLLCRLNRERYDISAVVLGRPCGSVLEEELDASGVPLTFLGKGPGFAPGMFGRVHGILKKLQPDVLHTHVHVLRYALPSILARPVAVMLHTVHNLAEHEVERRAQWMQNLAFRRGILPVAVSDEVAISLKRRYNIDFSPVIANRIPLAPYMSCREKRDIVRGELGFESNQLVFTCVALFRPQKNHSLLISAFASGPGRNKHNQLLLVGTGPTQAAAGEQARQLGIDGQVHFLGMRNDIADILGASDVFVLASDFEGNPLAVMEAMAAGLPIVSTRAGGVPELLTDGCEGILVPVMDSVALVRALVRIEQRDLRCSMGSAATLRARKSFDVNVMVSAYESLYEELLQSRIPR